MMLVLAVVRTVNSTASVYLLRYLPARARRAARSFWSFSVLTYRCLKSTWPSLMRKALTMPSPLIHWKAKHDVSQKSVDDGHGILVQECKWKSVTYNIVFNVGREGWVWVHAVERPVELLGDFTLDHETVDVCLETVGCQELSEYWLLRPCLRVWVRDSEVASHTSEFGVFGERFTST